MSLKAQAVSPPNARSRRAHRLISVLALPVLTLTVVVGMQGASGPHGATDPGVRSGASGAGTPIAGLTTNQLSFFSSGLTDFLEIDSVSGTIGNTGTGLGPRFNAGELCPMPRPTSHRRNQPVCESTGSSSQRSRCHQSVAFFHSAQRAGARGSLSIHAGLADMWMAESTHFHYQR